MTSLSRELVFLILQFLNEEKFKETVHKLEQESGYFFNMKYFEDQVQAGDWEEVERYLSGFTKVDDNRYSMKIFFDIRKQKYLEALNRKSEIMAESSRISGYRFSYRQMMLGLMVLMLIKIGAAQNDANTCVSSIIPCKDYLNATTKPPDSCCLPLLNVIQTQEKCLCNLLNSSIVKQMGINMTQALNVPRLCGDKNVTTDACSTVTGKAPSASTTPSGTADSSDSSGIGSTSLQIPLPLLVVLSLGVFKSIS